MTKQLTIFVLTILFVNTITGQNYNPEDSLSQAAKLDIEFEGRPITDTTFLVIIDNNIGLYLKTDERGQTDFLRLRPGFHNLIIRSKVYGNLRIKDIPIKYAKNTYIDVEFTRQTMTNKSQTVEVPYKFTKHVSND